ncbi:MAG: subclass B1 metallo-beta-lactamase [Myxococcota bacterium]
MLSWLGLGLVACAASSANETAVIQPEGVQLSSDVTVRPLTETVWLHTSLKALRRWGLIRTNGLIVISERELTLVDTAWTVPQTKIILDWATRTFDRPVTRAVLTHAHDDKMGGVAALRAQKVRTYAHQLSNMAAPRVGLLPADRALAFDSAGFVRVGAVTAYYPGPGHTIDNIVVAAPGQVLFGGCLIRPGGTKSLGNTADADVAYWDESVASVKRAFPAATTVVPSHGPPAGPELLDATIALARSADVGVGLEGLWTRTHRVVTRYEKLLAASHGGSTPTRLARELGVPSDDVDGFLNFALNYGPTSISVERLRIRYPHYAPGPVQADLERLAQRGWLAPENLEGTFAVTPKGRALVQRAFVLEVEIATQASKGAEAALGRIASVLGRVAEAASGLDDGEVNTSIAWRRAAFRQPASAPPFAQATQTLRDVVAFTDDNAHSRLHRLRRKAPFPEGVDALGQELFSALRGGQTYPLAHCAAHGTWRVGSKACRASMDALVRLGLVELGDEGQFRQTRLGAAFSDMADREAHRRLYRTWQTLSADELSAFRAALARLEAEADALELR